MGARPVTAALLMTEKDFMGWVRDAAGTFGWEYYHPFLSINSSRGWPDVALCRPPRLILAELKTDRRGSEPSDAQLMWLDLLGRCATRSWWPPDEPLEPSTPAPAAGLEVYLWRPSMRDEIESILR